MVRLLVGTLGIPVDLYSGGKAGLEFVGWMERRRETLRRWIKYDRKPYGVIS